MDKDSNFDAAATKPSRVRTKLNTKGCCFLCLTVIPSDYNVESTSTGSSATANTKPLVSLKSLQRYFGINKSIIKNKVPPPVSLDSATTATTQTQQDIEVELCESCENVVGEFKNAFLSLEKAQMELNYWSEKIHRQIWEGSKKPELVQNYSKRMTSDVVTLTQLVGVDNLRKELSSKSLTTRTGSKAQVYLHKSKREYTEDGAVGDKVWSQSIEDSCNEDIDAEEEEISHSFYMDNVNEDFEITVPSNATIKEEKPEIPQRTFVPSTVSPFFPTGTKMYVRNPKTGIYSCTSCNKKLKSQAGAKLHYEAFHLGIRYTCQGCGSQFKEKKQFEKHKRRCNGKKRKSFSISNVKKWNLNSQTGKYACAVCAKEFGGKSGAYYHYEAAHLKKKHKCEICKMAVFSQLSGLTTHQKTCEATLKKRLSLKLRRENDPKFKFRCSAPDCGKKFELRAVVERHFRDVHLKERNHSCDVCGKKFSTDRNVRLHKERVHLGRKFNCKICNQKYRCKAMLGEHEEQCTKKAT